MSNNYVNKKTSFNISVEVIENNRDNHNNHSKTLHNHFEMRLEGGDIKGFIIKHLDSSPPSLIEKQFSLYDRSQKGGRRHIYLQ